jgi:hypothetical protein
VNNIADNLARVRSQIRAAAHRAGRDPADIKLLAISKSHPAEAVEQAYEAGIASFGESRAQEGREKVAELRHLSISWHFVGHVQTNKVKYLLGAYELIHSLDRWKLAVEIDKRAQREGTKQPCLVQVNISGEDSKYGLPPTAVSGFLDRVAPLEGIQVKGLMTIAPLVEDPEETRPCFRRLRELAEELRPGLPSGVRLSELSMGMTNDFEVAVEEGATILRVGRAIFGERP